MFQPTAKDSGTQYTQTVALLVLAFIFSPAVLVLSDRLGYVSISLAATGSALCILLAWLSWIKYSRLTISSIETPFKRSK